ncbi:MAG: hypothetical protein ABIS14_03195 [Sphingomonas sp.]
MAAAGSTLYILLAIALFAGLMFGLALHPGGRKWRRQYEEERALRRTAEERADANERTLHEERSRRPLHPSEVRTDLDEKPVYISGRDAPITRG